MNITHQILGKDVSSIIFKYLTLNNKENYLKVIKYINNVYNILDFKVEDDYEIYNPSFIKNDQNEFHRFFYWDNNNWVKNKLIFE